jgi:5'(3')-deoxyribonucleotidase
MAVTAVDIQQLEQFADRIFANVGIDVEFTKHFKDRVNSERNAKPIVPAELTRLFKQERKRYGKPIAQMGPDSEAVMRDLQTDINVPFALVFDKENNELDLIAKTIMRKDNFTTPNRVFAVEDSPFRIGTRYEMPRKSIRPLPVIEETIVLNRIFEDIDADAEIYVDMDGVLADFFGEWARLMDKENWRDIKDVSPALAKIRATDNFWLNLPLLPQAKKLLAMIKQVKGEYNICTSPLADDPNSIPHKREWIEKNLSFFPPKNVYITHNKPQYATNNNGTPNILIDDYGVNIDAWEAAGGIGIKHNDNKFERTKKALTSQQAVTEGATRKHPKEPGAYLMTHNGIEYKISRHLDDNDIHRGEWDIYSKGVSAFSGDNWEWVDTVTARWNAIARVKGLSESKEQPKIAFDWLSESRAYRTPRHLNGLTLKQLGEQLFEQLLALQVFVNSDPAYAARIAEEIMKLQNWPGFRTSQPDLYNVIAILMKPEKFKDRVVQNAQITIPELRLKRNLRQIMKREFNNSDYSYMMLMLQRQMEDFLPAPLIQMRRQISNWERQTPRDKNTIRQRLMLQMRKTGLQNEFYEFMRRSLMRVKR